MNIRDIVEELAADGRLTGDNLALDGQAIAIPAPTAEDSHNFVVPLPNWPGAEELIVSGEFDPNDPKWRQYDENGRGPRTPYGFFRIREVDEWLDGLVDAGPDRKTRRWLESNAKCFFILNEWGHQGTWNSGPHVSKDDTLTPVQKRCIDYVLDRGFWFGGSAMGMILRADGRLLPMPGSVGYTDPSIDTNAEVLKRQQTNLEQSGGWLR